MILLQREKHMETSAQSTGEQSAAMRLLVACGVIAQLLNSVVILILGAIRPGYNAWIVPDSNLELGDGGWIQITNYIVTGALLLAFAIGMRLLLRTGRGSTWGPILLGIYGLTFIVTGPILPDPALGYPPGASSALTIHGAIHILFCLLQFTSLIAAFFVLATRHAALKRGGWSSSSFSPSLIVLPPFFPLLLPHHIFTSP